MNFSLVPLFFFVEKVVSIVIFYTPKVESRAHVIAWKLPIVPETVMTCTKKKKKNLMQWKKCWFIQFYFVKCLHEKCVRTKAMWVSWGQDKETWFQTKTFPEVCLRLVWQVPRTTIINVWTSTMNIRRLKWSRTKMVWNDMAWWCQNSVIYSILVIRLDPSKATKFPILIFYGVLHKSRKSAQD